MKQKIPKPPPNLARAGRDLWRRINADYDLDNSALAILARAAEALDRMTEAAELIDKDGVVITDRFGQLKGHPATVVERDSRSGFLAAMKMLGLDLEPIHDGPGRPAGGNG